MLTSHRGMFRFVVGLIAVAPLSMAASTASAADDTSYTWSTPQFVITPEFMGIPGDGSIRAGVNSGGFIDGAGKLRIIFATGTTVSGNASAVSSDGGQTWTLDSAFTWPASISDTLGHIYVTPSPTGGFRAFLRDATGVKTAVSADGQTWAPEDGYRVRAADLGLQRIDGGAVVRLTNGTYKMYLGDESDYFRQCGSARPVSTKIYSASSTDQLNWTVDPGYRIGTELGELCKLHPHAFTDAAGAPVVVFHVNNDISKSRSEWASSCFIASSVDGVTFPSMSRLPVNLPNGTPGGELSCDDPDIVRMPDGTLRLFFSVGGPLPNGGRVAMSVGTPVSLPATGTNPIDGLVWGLAVSTAGALLVVATRRQRIFNP